MRGKLEGFRPNDSLDWRPSVTTMKWIATKDRMPESGVPVLIASINAHGKSRRLRAIYAAPKTLPLSEWCEPASEAAEYDEESDEFYCLPGWYERNEYDYVNWAVEGEVTHWMPLPELPEEHNAEAQGRLVRDNG